jgi:hypothetical protein
MLVGVVTVLLSPEPAARPLPGAAEAEHAMAERLALRLPRWLARFAAWLHGAAVNPFVDFVVRYRWHALLILALISVYRISDVVMGVMANPFYRDMGFTKDEVAAVSKVYGLIMTLAGVGLGGVMVEALKDVSFRVAPFDEEVARAMVDGIRARRVLDGMRGAPPADVDALARAIAALSRFAAANAERIDSLDLNPFVVLPRDGSGIGGVKAMALDAVLITRA